MKLVPKIMGVVTVNDKGQVVIPAGARNEVSVKAGDKLLVMVHPNHESIVLVKPEGIEAHAKQLLDQVNNIKNKY